MKESLLTMNQLLSAVKGNALNDKKECYFEKVATDSREVVENTLFVPLIGEVQNGHKYIPQAIEKKASVIFINQDEYDGKRSYYDQLATENTEIAFVCVKNTLHALQDAAEAYVARFPNLIKISITGSSGKTTTKELVVSVMREYFGEENIAYTKGNYNSETGLPLSVFQIKGNEKAGIFEMGMNRVNEIGEISKVLKSKYGIITNIGSAHIGILGSQKNIAQEKRKSFDYIPADGAVFVPADDVFADYCVENVRGKVVRYGKNIPCSESGVQFIQDKGLAGTVFSYENQIINFPLIGEYNYQNALAVIALARELNIPANVVKAGLENIKVVSGRMDSKKITLKSGKSVMYISDCYNANPDSMGKVIDFCGRISNTGRKIFLLGDMKELGADSKSAHEKIADKIISSGADFVYLVGEEMFSCYEKLAANNFEGMAFYFADNSDKNFEEIAEKINENSSEDDVILVKGSHSMALEKIEPLLQNSCEKLETDRGGEKC